MNLSPTPVHNPVDISRTPAANRVRRRRSRTLVIARAVVFTLFCAAVFLIFAILAGALLLIAMGDPLT